MSVATFRTHPVTAELLDGIVARPSASVLIHSADIAEAAGVASELSRRLLCPTDCADGSCGSCRKQATGNHADFIALSPDEKGKIGIEEVQRLQHQLQYGQYELAGRRVVLIMGAHTATLPAQQALLKTVEEPPADTTLVLTATDPARLLPTIVSRCRPVYVPATMASALESPLESGSLLDRLVAAKTLADGELDADALVRSLHAAVRERQGQDAPARTLGRLDAIMRLSERLGANVAPRAALEAYVLEAAAC